jgi:hypothetical protein
MYHVFQIVEKVCNVTSIVNVSRFGHFNQAPLHFLISVTLAWMTCYMAYKEMPYLTYKFIEHFLVLFSPPFVI